MRSSAAALLLVALAASNASAATFRADSSVAESGKTSGATVTARGFKGVGLGLFTSAAGSTNVGGAANGNTGSANGSATASGSVAVGIVSVPQLALLGDLKPPVAAYGFASAAVEASALAADFEKLDATFKLSASASSLLTLYESIVEFNDQNGNGVFDKDADKMVSTYSLGKQGWTDITAAQVDSQLYSLTTATRDNVFKITFYFSTVAGYVDNAVVSPLVMRTAIEINSFPFVNTNSTSRLALNTLVLAGQAAASANGNAFGTVSVSQNTIQTNAGGNGNATLYVSWDGKADVTKNGADASGKATVRATVTDPESKTSAVVFLEAQAKASAQAQYSVKRITYNIDGVQPNSLKFTQAVGGEMFLTRSAAVGAASANTAFAAFVALAVSAIALF